MSTDARGMVDFTFAIVNWNTKDLLGACLDSIRREAAGFSVQTLVADNASDDGSADMVRGAFPECALIRHPRNLGFAAGHEALFALSRGRYHVLVNPDVELTPGCLTALDRRMREDPAVAILGPQLIGADGVIQPGCRRFPTLVNQLVEASAIGHVFPHSRLLNGYRMGDFDHRSARDVDQVMGSFFVIRASLIAQIGILDTRFYMYYEEVDYCLRARRAGHRVFFEPAARVNHLGGGASASVRVETVRRKMRSMHEYFRKHIGRRAYLPMVAISALAAVTHSLAALVTGRDFPRTVRAYRLACWDVLCARPSRYAEPGSDANA